MGVAYNPITVNNRYGHTGESILASLADTLKSASFGLAIPRSVGDSPSDRSTLWTLQGDGWTRGDIQGYLMEHATRPLAELIRLGVAQGPEKPGDDQLVLRCSRDPEDILLVMGGGTGGRNSAIIDTYSFKIRTRKVEVPAG